MFKKEKIKLTIECEEAFLNIKDKLTSVHKLNHFNQNLPLLTCDASDIGLGTVISNRDKHGTLKPIVYASRKLNSTEIKYSTINKEALAIIFGVTKFCNCTYGRHFELETDNAALFRIFGPTKAIPKMTAKRLQHYAIFLSAFDYKIRHIKSSLNPADYLSRTVKSVNKLNMSLHDIC